MKAIRESMLSEIPTTIAVLNNLKELTKAIINSKVDSALREQAIESQFGIIDAQNAIITLQSQYQSLLEEKDQLKKQLIEMENWEAEREKDMLTEMVPGVFVYALKPDHKESSPSHWLCPDCYGHKKTSILQFEGDVYCNTHNCHQCGLKLLDHTGNAMPR